MYACIVLCALAGIICIIKSHYGFIVSGVSFEFSIKPDIYHKLDIDGTDVF